MLGLGGESGHVFLHELFAARDSHELQDHSIEGYIAVRADANVKVAVGTCIPLEGTRFPTTRAWDAADPPVCVGFPAARHAFTGFLRNLSAWGQVAQWGSRSPAFIGMLFPAGVRYQSSSAPQSRHFPDPVNS